MITFQYDDLKKLDTMLDDAPARVAAALAEDLVSSAFAARTAIIQEAPFWWHERSSGFLRNSLHLGPYAQAGDLQQSIFASILGGKLLLHETGGTITPTNAQSIVIPITGGPTQTAHGIRPDQKPKALANSFRRGDIIYQRQGKGKGSRIKAMYKLQPSVQLPKDTHFNDVFETTIREEMSRNFAASMIRAILHGH